MSKTPTYHDWSLDDILSYLDASMNAENRTRFEAQLRHDPMLRDAVDGLSAHAKIHVDHHYQQLEARFASIPQASRKTISFKRLLMAASVALLGMAAVGIYYFYPSADDNFTAATPEEVTSDVDINTIPQHAEPPAPALASDTDSFWPDSTMAVLDEELELGAKSIQYAERDAQESPYTDGANLSRGDLRPTSALSGGVMRGYVRDQEGVTIEGATLYFPNNEVSIVSDEDGSFAVDLKSYDSVVYVQHDRHNRITARVDFGALNTLTMTEDPAYRRRLAVVQDSLARSQAQQTETTSEPIKRSPKAQVRYGTARPEKGLRKYAKYVKKQMRYPAAAQVADIEGPVVLQFKVNLDGSIFDIVVLQGLGYGCDTEAKRLLLEGPKWLVDDGYRVGQASYTFQFNK